jgi:sortase (surface protein transpeptidase)
MKLPSIIIKIRELKMRSIIPIIIFGIIGSCLFIVLPSIKQQIIPSAPISPLSSSSKLPTQLIINRIGLDLVLKEATISANNWQIYPDAASHLHGSGDLGGGNMIIYGHNTPAILGKIIQLGTENEILVKNQYLEKRYKVTQVFQTTRDDLSQINNTDDQLTIYTCSGWFDANRFFIIAKPINP